MADEDGAASRGLDDTAEAEDRVRALVEAKGLQLRRSDERPGMYHLVDPKIDGKLYAFSFTHPHSYTLSEIEALLKREA